MGGETLRELVSRLVEDGKAYVQAEVRVVKATANAWLMPAKIAVPLLVGAILIVQASLTILIGALGFLLAMWIGTAGGFAVAAIVGLAVAGGMVAFAISKFPKGDGR